MSFEFNKSLLIDNIEYLLRERNKRVGELEAEIVVSAGYISRISKEGGSKPGVDFIGKVAEALNVSIDTLLTVPLTDITPTEKYLITFFEKLKRNTASDTLAWEKESAKLLNNMEPDPEDGSIPHPLFRYIPISGYNPDKLVEDPGCVVFPSNAFGNDTEIYNDCYNLEMKDGARLFLMNVTEKDDENSVLGSYNEIEVWMWIPGTEAHHICSTWSRPIFASLIEDLYQTVTEFSKHPKLKKDLKAVIDAFMADDLSTKKSDKTVVEDDDDLPF